MSTAIAGFTPTTPTATAQSSSLNGMTSGDFLSLMIQQLQQQDPLNPTDSNQLLTQMSQISTLQSNTNMEQSLTGLTLQQSIGAGGNLIGKTVTGLDSSGTSITGAVTSVKIINQNVNLELDNGTGELPMSNVTQIQAAPAGTVAAPAAAAIPATAQSNIQKILAALGIGS